MDENQRANDPNGNQPRLPRAGEHPHPGFFAGRRPRPPVHRTPVQRELAERRQEREARRAERALGREERQAKRRAQQEEAARKEAHKQARNRQREEHYYAARAQRYEQVQSGSETFPPSAPELEQDNSSSLQSGEPEVQHSQPSQAATAAEEAAALEVTERDPLGERPVIVVRRPIGWSRVVLVGLGAALISWLIPVVVAVIAFLLTASNSWVLSLDLSDAMTVGTDIWALANFAVVAKAISLVPLGLSAINLAISVLALRSTRVRSILTRALFIPMHLLTSVLIAAFTHSHASFLSVSVGSLTMATAAWLVVSWPTLRSDLETQLQRRDQRKSNSDTPGVTAMVQALRRGITDGVMSVAVVALLGLVVLLGAVIFQWQRVVGIHELVVRSFSDGAMLWLGQILYLPNAAAWVGAWGAGPGFYLGTDTMHMPTHAPANPIPAIPLLGAIPQHPVGNWVVVMPIALGIAIGGWMTWRRSETTVVEQVAHAVAALAGFAVLSTAWMWLSTGSIGTGRMSALGPRWLLAATLLTLEVALSAALVYLLAYPPVRAYLGGQGQQARNQMGQMRRRLKPPAGSIATEDADEDGVTASANEAEPDASNPEGDSGQALTQEATGNAASGEVLGGGEMPVIQAGAARDAARQEDAPRGNTVRESGERRGAGSGAEASSDTAAAQTSDTSRDLPEPEVDRENEIALGKLWKILESEKTTDLELDNGGELSSAIPASYLDEEITAVVGHAQPLAEPHPPVPAKTPAGEGENAARSQSGEETDPDQPDLVTPTGAPEEGQTHSDK